MGQGYEELTLTLSPETATNPIGTPHTVTVTALGEYGEPIEDLCYEQVISGPNKGNAGGGSTNENGQFSLRYTGTGAGTEQMRSFFYF